MPKYKDIDIKLSGVDGNVYSILGKCMKAFKKYLNENKLDIGEADSFYEEATSGDYDHVIQTCMKWFNII